MNDKVDYILRCGLVGLIIVLLPILVYAVGLAHLG